MTYQWVDCDRDFVRERYDHIADLIVFFEWLLFVPTSFRKKAAQSLHLKHGDCVVELGCGTGRNLPHLREAVGPDGRVYGIDLSPGMLAKAHDLCARHRWTNVELIQGDAAEFVAPRQLDAALFGLSYNTMPNHLAVLNHVWKQLRPSGRLCIMDARAPTGFGCDLALRFGIWLMKHTLLGNPLIQPWNDLLTLAHECSTQEFMFGSYFICTGSKHPCEGMISNGSTEIAP